MGTVVESPTEYFSARINKKNRKATIVEELLADQKSQAHFKKKYNEIQEQAASGGRKWYRQMKDRRKRRK
jgi:Fcf2 pre-rRNA processing